jgi:hypothetical protein
LFKLNAWLRNFTTKAQKEHEGEIKCGNLALCVPWRAFVVNILPVGSRRWWLNLISMRLPVDFSFKTGYIENGDVCP